MHAALALLVTFLITNDAIEIERAYLRAIYSNDAAGTASTSLPNPKAKLLLGTNRLTFAELNAVAHEAAAANFEEVEPPTFRGRPSTRDANGRYPTGAIVRHVTSFRGTPLVVTAVMTDVGWKVDPRWWIAMAEQGLDHEPQPGTPDFAIKALVTALVTGDHDGALHFVVPGSNSSLLFNGEPKYVDDSDVLPSLALEMPLVEIPPGEFYALPSGEIVEGSRDPRTSKLLVGLFGSDEIAFVVKKVGAKWRVVPQSYFAILNR